MFGTPTCCALKNDSTRCRQYARKEFLTCRVYADKPVVFDDLAAHRKYAEDHAEGTLQAVFDSWNRLPPGSMSCVIL